MNVALVGVGGAGGRVVDATLAAEDASGRRFAGDRALCLDTDGNALAALERLPPDGYLRLGGVAGDDDEPPAHEPERGVEAARAARGDVADAVDHLDLPAVDLVLVAAGLGGSTGGGATPVVVDTLQGVTDAPVHALAVLPAADEGRAAARCAIRSLQSVVAAADAVLAFDDDAWGPPAPTSPEEYDEANAALATRLDALLGTGATDADSIVDRRLDPGDLARTLAPGGLATLGYAAIDAPTSASGGSRRLSRLLGRGGGDDESDDGGPDADAIAYLARRATRGKLTLPCDVASAERALVLRTGPSRALAGTGFEDGRYWLEGEADTVEVLAADEPHEPADELACAVLLANVTSVPAVEALTARALGE